MKRSTKELALCGVMTALSVVLLCLGGVIPLAVQYTVVDGFTGMGIAKVAITLSLFRKSIYFLSVVLIPLLTGVTNVFFAETVSDFAGPVFSIILFLLVFKKVVGDPKQVSAA